MTFTYVISSLVWILVGVAIGIPIGRKMGQKGEIDKMWLLRPGWLRNNALGLVTLLVVGAATFALVRTTQCQAEYNKAYTEALQERSDAAATDRQAQRDLIVSMLTNPGDPEAARRALDKYLRSLAGADSVRSRHPIPTNTCR